MSTAAIALVVAAAAAVAGFTAGVQWQQGREAIALAEAKDKLRDQARLADIAAINHAETVTRLNNQLGSTRAQLHSLSTGRDCLSGRAVRLLNGAAAGVPGAASEPAREAEAFATDRDVGDALAVCRAGYERLSNQLNAILDIEDSRQ